MTLPVEQRTALELAYSRGLRKRRSPSGRRPAAGDGQDAHSNSADQLRRSVRSCDGSSRGYRREARGIRARQLPSTRAAKVAAHLRECAACAVRRVNSTSDARESASPWTP